MDNYGKYKGLFNGERRIKDIQKLPQLKIVPVLSADYLAQTHARMEKSKGLSNPKK